jgi:CRP-like cAMP-binding protein
MHGEGSDRGDPLIALFAGGEPRAVARGVRLHHAGEPLTQLHLIVRGWTGRSRSTAAGEAAFTGVHMAGDIPCVDGVVNERVGDELFMLCDGVVRQAPVELVRDAAARDPAVAGALLRLMAGETAFLRGALFAVGRLSCSQRLANFILQTFHRLVAAGLVAPTQRRFALPLTQSQLAAVTGVTAVHLNRVVQQLRAQGWLELGGGFARIVDMAALEGEAAAGAASGAGTGASPILKAANLT